MVPQTIGIVEALDVDYDALEERLHHDPVRPRVGLGHLWLADDDEVLGAHGALVDTSTKAVGNEPHSLNVLEELGESSKRVLRKVAVQVDGLGVGEASGVRHCRAKARLGAARVYIEREVVVGYEDLNVAVQPWVHDGSDRAACPLQPHERVAVAVAEDHVKDVREYDVVDGDSSRSRMRGRCSWRDRRRRPTARVLEQWRAPSLRCHERH